MKPKEKELLSLLYQNQNRFLTGRELAQALHISERTVRSYIRRMEPVITENGGEILAKQGNGYRLLLRRPVQFAVLAGTPGTETTRKTAQTPDSAQERRRYLMQRLLLNGETLQAEETAERLYVSTSTLKKELYQLRGMLDEYGLVFDSGPAGISIHGDETSKRALIRLYVSTSTLKKELYQLRGMLDEYGLVFDSGPAGISIHGDETSKRALIMDYFFRSSTFNSIQEYMDHSGYFDDIPTEQLLRMVLDESRQFGIRLSDIMVQNVLLHLALSVKRMQAGLRPEHAVLPPAFEQSSEYQASSAIFRRLSGMTGGEYPAEEVSYLALHLSGKGSWATRQPAQGEHLEQEVKTVLSQLAEDDVMQLDEDPQLVSSLLEHLRPMVVRLMRGLPQKNPLTQDILRDQPDLMKVIRKYFGAMPCLRRYDIDDDEWAYLALHIMAALERQKEKRKLQVLVVCATGYGSSQLLKSRLMKHFSDSLYLALHIMAALERQKEKRKLQVLVVCATGYGSSQLLKSRLMKHFSDSLHIVTETGYYEMSDDILQGIDLIISSVNIGPVIFGVPFIHVSVFLGEEDVQNIQRFDDILQGIDLIISSVNIGPVIFGVPFIHVSVFLGEEDVQNIQRFIDQEKAGPEKKEPAAARPASKSQKEIFDCYFSEEDFRVYKGHPERDQVLSDLVETLACYEKDSFADHMREQIRLRSQMGSLVFSDTIAVPHPAVPLSKVARLALALIPEGMYWNESHPAIRFVFLMSPSYVENRNLPKVTGAIVSLMEEPVLQEQILQEQSESHPAIRFVFLMSPSYVENRNLPKVTGAIVSLMEEPVLQEQILQEQSFDVFGRILGSLIETA